MITPLPELMICCWFRTHFKAKCSALGDFGVSNPVTIQQLVIQPDFLNIRMIRGRIVGQNRQSPVSQLDFSAFPERPGDLVAIRAGRGKESQRTEHVPRREGAPVVVSIQTVFTIPVLRLQNPPDPIMDPKV